MKLGGLALLLVACSGSVDGGGGPVISADHPRIYLPTQRSRLETALLAPSPAAARFRTMVDRQLDGADYYDFQPWHAALLGELTADARYCTYAVAQVDAMVSEEYARIDGGDDPRIAGDSYLGVGDEVANIAITYDYCTGFITRSQQTRWLSFCDQAIYNVWHPEMATWGGREAPWSGWSIDNPSNNYYYSFLRATLLFGLAAKGEFATADGWIQWFRASKIEDQLVPQFDSDLVGGGSREGTGYGVSMRDLWWLYDVWASSTGEDIASLTPHTRASLVEMLHTILPTRDRIAPLGDQSRDASASLFDYHRSYLLGLVRLFPHDPAAPEALYTLSHSTVPRMDQEFMEVYDFLYEPEGITEVEPALHPVFYGPGTGQLFARSSWAEDATWIGTTCGPFTEDHAHQDQGQLLIFKKGWLADDQNMRSHSGIHGETTMHNLVRLERDGQVLAMRRNAGEGQLLALEEGDGWLHFAMETAGLYPDSAGVSSLRREVVTIGADTIVVLDHVEGTGTAVWQLNSAFAPSVNGPTATITGDGATLEIQRLFPTSGSFSSSDWSSLDGDMSGGYRLDSPAGGQDFLHVLSLDGAVTQATLVQDGGQLGVSLTLAGGQTAEVRFTPASVDGSIALDGGSAQPLGPVVHQPPER